MRLATLFIACLSASLAHGQLSGGVVGALGHDHGWRRHSGAAGGLLEWRPSDSTALVIRLSGTRVLVPDRRLQQNWSKDGALVGTWTMEEHVNLWGAALEVKWPLGRFHCDEGLYRGSYVIGGIGIHVGERTRREHAIRHTTGEESEVKWSTAVRQPHARIAVGAQYGTRWGHPFAEVGITVAPEPLGEKGHWLIPALMGIQVGCRFPLIQR